MSRTGGDPRVLVVGGGISGLTAALELAETGQDVVLVEKAPSLGGRVAQLHQYFPKLCPPACGLEINYRRLRTNPRVRCLTMAEVVQIAGEPGRYQVTIRQHPRFVNERCTACGACADVCPAERSDTFNLGMSTTKAAYLPHAVAHPLRFVIDGEACRGAACGECVTACPYEAIDLEMRPTSIEVEVRTVVWATGWDPFDATKLDHLGYGRYANVITNLAMERLASGNGPTGGRIQRPSDGEPPASVAFVQCAGSRDENYLKHCSGVCCLASLKQARYVREQAPDAEVYIFYIDIRAPGRLEDFYAATQADDKLALVKGKVARISEDPATHRLTVEAEDTLTGAAVSRAVDLVVLATGMVPVGAGEARVSVGLQTDEHGFLNAEQPWSGMLVAGCAKRPADVAACVRDATGVAMQAVQAGVG